jgi:hypothetical protein
MVFSTMMTFSIPLTMSDRQQAEAFKAMHPIAQQANQVYENTLAVLATHRYLEMLGIPTELENSYCWNPIDFLSTNIADLYLPETRGRLECRSVRFGEEHCFIPDDVWGDRVGYVVVRLNETNTEAVVLGFVPEVETEQVLLSELRSLDDLIDLLSLIPDPNLIPKVTDLTAWFQGRFEPWWKSSKELIKPRVPILAMASARTVDTTNLTHDEIQKQVEQLCQQAKLKQADFSIPSTDTAPESALAYLIEQLHDDAIRWKAAELLWILNPEHPNSPRMRTQELGISLNEHNILLTAGIVIKPTGQRLILLRVSPDQHKSHLPNGLKLVALDEHGTKFADKKSGQLDKLMSVLMTAEPGDCFSASVALDETIVVESFQV